MNTTIKKAGAIVTSVAVVLSFAAAPAAAYNDHHNNGNNGEPTHVYRADLESLNDSGVNGHALIKLTGDEYTVKIKADGLEANKEHPQHIHGFADDREAVSPTMEQDTNNDGIVSLEEGLVTYGPIMQSLTPFQTADNGKIHYKESFTVDQSSDDKDVTPLEKREIVLHGKTVNGEYWAVLPVASGELEYVKTNYGNDKSHDDNHDNGNHNGYDNRDDHGYGYHMNGNGYGSRNHIDFRSINNTRVSQSNESRINNDVRVEANTGNNRSDFNTGGFSFIRSGDAFQMVELFNGGGLNFFSR